MIKENGWTLRYLIGDVLAGFVAVGDEIHLPGNQTVNGSGVVRVLGGKAPVRFKDAGAIQIFDNVTEGGLGARPGALGCVWVNDESGGWAELP